MCPQGREWHWDSFGSPGTGVGRMGIMRALWMNRHHCLSGLGPLGHARTAQVPASWNLCWSDRESLQCIVCPFAWSSGLSWQHNSMPCVFFPPCRWLCLTPFNALSGALNIAGVRRPQAEVNRMKPWQEIQPKGPPYLVQCDDPIGLIGRFPLDVDLLLKWPPLDGL